MQAFWPLPSEPNIRPLLRAWVAAGVRVCLPRVVGERMLLYAVDDLDWLIISDLGVAEPDPEACKQIEIAAIDLILVPGLAFSPRHERLERGGGYYDRFLAGVGTSVPKIGIAFDCQVFDSVPTEAHDVPMTSLVTERTAL